MNRTYSISDSLFGDGHIVHASQPIGDDRISVSCRAATIAEARKKADAKLDDELALWSQRHGQVHARRNYSTLMVFQ